MFFDRSSCSETGRKSQCRIRKNCYYFLLLNKSGENEEWCFVNNIFRKRAKKVNVKKFAKRAKFFDHLRLFRSSFCFYFTFWDKMFFFLKTF